MSRFQVTAEVAAASAIVEPTGPIENDPNLTNEWLTGSPTMSHGSKDPFRVIGEEAEWDVHSPDRLKEMHDHLENLRWRGVEAVEE